MAGRVTLEAALRAVTLAREVERLSENHRGPRPGKRQAKRNELGEVTDDRVLEAVHAGATTAQLAEALGCGISRAKERVRVARKAAGVWVAPVPRPVRSRTPPEVGQPDPPAPDETVWLKPPERVAHAPNPWLEVSRCGATAPPPWPVSARCKLEARHGGSHRP